MFGGSTDLEVYSNEYGGICISLAINIRQHITIDTNTDYEDGYIFDIPSGASTTFYKAFFDELGYNPRFHNFIASFDASIESGLGSSASAAVALIGAIAKYQNKDFTRSEIAELAYTIEVNKLGLYGGRQDQYAAAFGGMNVFSFSKEGIDITPLNKNKQWERSILLFYTGRNRTNTKIQENLKTLTPKQKDSLDTIKSLALLAQKHIDSGDIVTVGQLLDYSWRAKKESNIAVTNEHIDKIYTTAINAGAYGGKIIGSGGGGYIIFVAEPSSHNQITHELEKLRCTKIDFSVDYNGLEVRSIL